MFRLSIADHVEKIEMFDIVLSKEHEQLRNQSPANSFSSVRRLDPNVIDTA